MFQNKTTQSKEFIHTSDTLIQVVDRIIEKPVFTETIIQEPCDSNGILRSFETSIQTQKGTVKVYSDSNKIHAFIESISDTCINETRYQTKEIMVYQNKLITKYKTPRWAWYSLMANVLLVSYLTRKLWL